MNEIRLRPVEAGDAPAMLRWMQDPAVADNLGLSREPSLERTQAWIADALAADACAPYAILRDGEHVGNVVLDRIDRRLGTARFSIYVGEPAARGQGVGTAATRRVLDEAFGPLGLQKVWLVVHVGNLPAIRAYGAAGFRLEGVHRGEFLLGDVRVDVFYMGILAEDPRG